MKWRVFYIGSRGRGLQQRSQLWWTGLCRTACSDHLAFRSLGVQITWRSDHLAFRSLGVQITWRSDHLAFRSLGVQITCRSLDSHCLQVDVQNQGNGFHPDLAAAGQMSDTELLSTHGRGISLMLALVDHVQVLSDGMNTVVRLTKSKTVSLSAAGILGYNVHS